MYTYESNTRTYPVVGVDRASRVRHVARHGRVARPEPDLDELGVPLHSVEATTDGVEAGTIAVLDASGRNTAAVVALTIEVARTADHATTVVGHGASWVGVKGDLVVDAVVDALNLYGTASCCIEKGHRLRAHNVDFTAGGPSSLGRLPECGPSTASLWHVASIEPIVCVSAFTRGNYHSDHSHNNVVRV